MILFLGQKCKEFAKKEMEWCYSVEYKDEDELLEVGRVISPMNQLTL